MRLALEDNNTTGKFLNQHFSLEDVRIKEGNDPVEIVSRLADRGVSLFIVDLPADALLKVADAGRSPASCSSTQGRSTIGCARKTAGPT